MSADNRNLITAIALSMLILLMYQLYFAPQEPAPTEGGQEQGFQGQTVEGLTPLNTDQILANTAVPLAATAPRVDILGDKVKGSISLAGGRIDDLQLIEFGEDSLNDENRVALLRRSGQEDSYFTEIGFIDQNGQNLVPRDAKWTADGDILTPETPLTLTHRRDDGTIFNLKYSLDEGYLVTVAASIQNQSGTAQNIRFYQRLLRNKPSENDFFISYEGPIGVFTEDVKEEISYGDIEDLSPNSTTPYSYQSEGIKGWIGITDKFWLAALIPDQQNDITFTFKRAEGSGVRTQVDLFTDGINVNNGDSLTRDFNIFAGPKEVPVLQMYNDQYNIERLDHAIDWGWFPFLTKPFFYALNWMYNLFGNFGLAILGLTIIVKIAFFPLANKSYKSMAKMRELAPKIQTMREEFPDDKKRQQQEMMQLYRSEKVNPAAGCLPILLQIPVFFALYKVLFINIQMRHAPFYGWIEDLSAIDPTSILNLFGLLPYSTAGLPDFLNLGVWPILMGITMYVQMSLNPPPPDPVQAKVFKFMPLFFTFLLATFPAGLVIYWTWNNLLSIIQQWYIMQSIKRVKT